MAERRTVDEARRTRLLELAQRVWAGAAWEVLTGNGVDVVTETGEIYLAVNDHPRAVDAATAALIVLDGKLPSALDELVAKWTEMARQEDDLAVAIARRMCAADLRQLLEQLGAWRGEGASDV